MAPVRHVLGAGPIHIRRGYQVQTRLDEHPNRGRRMLLNPHTQTYQPAIPIPAYWSLSVRRYVDIHFQGGSAKTVLNSTRPCAWHRFPPCSAARLCVARPSAPPSSAVPRWPGLSLSSYAICRNLKGSRSPSLDQSAQLSLAVPEVEPLTPSNQRMETVGSSKGSAHGPEPPPALSSWCRAA